MKYVVAVFVEGGRVLARCSVIVGYCVLQVVVVMECSREIMMAFGGVNEVVAIEYSS